MSNPPNKLTTETFIQKAIEVHGDKFDYTKVTYKDSVTPITIIDREDNTEFQIIPTNHLRGFSNEDRKRKSPIQRKARFIEKARRIHGDRYDYSLVEFKRGDHGNKSVVIRDNETGEIFSQSTQWHIRYGRTRVRAKDSIDHIIPLRFLGRRAEFDRFLKESPLYKFLDSEVNRRTVPLSENNTKGDAIIVDGVKYRARNIPASYHVILERALQQLLGLSEPQAKSLIAAQAMYMRPTGTLKAFVGPMFASKSTSLLREAAKTNGLLLKVPFDNRYGEETVVTHDGVEMKALLVRKLSDIPDHHTYLFDEIQFFQEPYFEGNIVTGVHDFLRRGKNVVVAGLDMDAFGNPFPFSPILGFADEVVKLKATCAICGKSASKTQKLGGDRETPIELGSTGLYEPRCNQHWRAE